MPFLGTTGGGSVKQYGGQANLGYFIKNSLRFRASNSAYLSRTPSVAGNRQTWTFSTWIKMSLIANDRIIFSGGTSNPLSLYRNNSGNLIVDVAGVGTYQTSSQIFRDPSAWYHIVWAFDTTQATSTNRSILYVNGSSIPLTQNSTFTQNTNYNINNATLQTIGIYAHYLADYFFDGYLAEINFIDGQALTPSSFGKTDAVTGQWIPKKFGGASYGTNGFYLKFADASAATAAAIGKDSSSNGNNWTPNNISVTAGVTYDSMQDVPTLTSATAANYAVLNAAIPKTYVSTTDGNLKSVGTSSTDSDTSVATIGVSSGKWYWEDKIGTINSAVYPILGAGRNILSSFIGKYPGDSSVGGFGIVVGNGNIVREGSIVTTVTALVANDVVGFALDLGALTCAIYKNNSLIYTVTSLTAGTYYPMANEYSSSNSTHNYGQQPFSYTPPSGFKSLNTYNLP